MTGFQEEKDVNEGPSSSSSGAAAAAGGSPLLSLVAPRMSDLSSGSMQVVAAGQPIFARMPPGIAWWPKERPWRICQESASLFARGVKSQKRVLKMDIPGGYAEKEAVEYLLSRQTSMDGLIDCAERGELLGLDELIADGDGAVVLKLPAVLGAKALAIAAPDDDDLDIARLSVEQEEAVCMQTGLFPHEIEEYTQRYHALRGQSKGLPYELLGNCSLVMRPRSLTRRSRIYWLRMW